MDDAAAAAGAVECCPRAAGAFRLSPVLAAGLVIQVRGIGRKPLWQVGVSMSREAVRRTSAREKVLDDVVTGAASGTRPEIRSQTRREGQVRGAPDRR